ncbi:hypothetical protein G6F62_011160 [Rhizopus arrhizus]|nr:hypothetical protein G6F62_011160 [Rhizopus arrhizus]
MNTTTHTLSSTESIPKRLRSASARLFSGSMNQSLHKQSSCQYEHLLEQTHNISYSVLNPSNWFPRIRNQSTSSSSSSSSVVCTPTAEHLPSYFSCHLENTSFELEELYNNAKIEIDFALESQGSIYYEGDYSTAYTAFAHCLAKYESTMQSFGDTANSIKFRFRWETDIQQLRIRLNALPPVQHSIYE